MLSKRNIELKPEVFEEQRRISYFKNIEEQHRSVCNLAWLQLDTTLGTKNHKCIRTNLIISSIQELDHKSPDISCTFLKMQYHLSDVCLSDAEKLIRQCQFPAMRRDPLQTIMFPKADIRTDEEEEEIIRWEIESLQRSLENDSCYFREVMFGPDRYVGFAIWLLESGSQGMRQKPQPNKRQESWDPVTLDVRAWMEISKRLREERTRVLHGHKAIWRLTSMSTAPEHQRKGVGSMLMQRGCDEADLHGWTSFVMASPDGVPLYRKFGFREVGQVWTEHGTYSSMFRESRNAVVKYAGQEKEAELADVQSQI
ncbi:hypothetical protein VTL71DRAFT_8140 [Oculimacula yallundae]|uniref:N-acetyltransferase domain-containing protein n=1 Tax=Oculimacula yallundae TaxID=86028 RepID=A0ABR4CWZ3_9HELO